MKYFLSSIFLFLLSSPLLAAVREEPAQAPVETVSMVYIVIFGLLFVGMIVGFFIYLWMNDKNEAQDK